MDDDTREKARAAILARLETADAEEVLPLAEALKALDPPPPPIYRRVAPSRSLPPLPY